LKRVRHIATSWAGSRVAIAQFERVVQIWDLACREQGAEFDTVLDFGGHRLAITSDGTRVLAGAYNRYGIAAYDGSNGELLWRRPDLKKVQHVRLSADDKRLCCGFDRRSEHILSVETGETLSQMPGVEDVLNSPHSPVSLIVLKGKPPTLRDVDGTLRGRIEKTTFAFLDYAFSPDLLITSESRGPLRCFRVADAAEVWRFQPEADTHALQVAYVEAGDAFCAIMWPFVKGGDHVLWRFNAADGRRPSTCVLPSSSQYGFCLRGSLILGWDGSVLDTATGELLCRLEFPNITDA
jgi:hypothetical protein